MSFTGEDIRDIVYGEIDETLDDGEVIQHVNSCLIEFAEEFRKTDTQSIVVTDTSAFYDRTSGHLSVVKITDSNGEDYDGEVEYSYDRSQIRFEDEGTFTVTSIVVPDAITLITDNINVNDIFKIGIARYVGAMYYLMDNDQDPDGLKMEARAIALITKASNILANTDKRLGRRLSIRRSAINYYE